MKQVGMRDLPNFHTDRESVFLQCTVLN